MTGSAAATQTICAGPAQHHRLALRRHGAIPGNEDPLLLDINFRIEAADQRRAGRHQDASTIVRKYGFGDHCPQIAGQLSADGCLQNARNDGALNDCLGRIEEQRRARLGISADEPQRFRYKRLQKRK